MTYKLGRVFACQVYNNMLNRSITDTKTAVSHLVGPCTPAALLCAHGCLQLMQGKLLMLWQLGLVPVWQSTLMYWLACLRYVAKTSMQQGTQLAGNIAEMEEDVNAHMMAGAYAKAFNAAMEAVQPGSAKLIFYDVHLLLLQDIIVPVGPQSALFLEPYLDGRSAFVLAGLMLRHSSLMLHSSAMLYDCAIATAPLPMAIN